MNLNLIMNQVRVVAREAGETMKLAFAQPKVVELKGRQDLVTETDKNIEKFLMERLHK